MYFRPPFSVASKASHCLSSTPDTRGTRVFPLPLALLALVGFLPACRIEQTAEPTLQESEVVHGGIPLSPGSAGPGSPGPVMGKYGGRLGYPAGGGGGQAGRYRMLADGAGGEVYG